jgi:hypothetical protein
MPVGVDTPYVAIFIPFSIMSTDTVIAPFISGLSSGTYQCVMTGASGCQKIFSITLDDPLPMTVGLDNMVPVLCYGDSTGSLTLDDVYGGTPPYTYAWSNGTSTNPVSAIPAGVYSVTVTDSLDCFITQTYQVEQPFEPIKYFPTVTGTTCPERDDGTIILYSQNIYWSPYQNSLVIYDSLGITPLDTLRPDEISGDMAAGQYILVLVNENGCYTKDTVYIPQGTQPCISIIIPNLVTANGDGSNDVFRVSGACDYDEFQVIIFTDMGGKVYESSDCNFIWDPRSDVKYSSGTVFYYYIKVTVSGVVREFRNSINVTY